MTDDNRNENLACNNDDSDKNYNSSTEKQEFEYNRISDDQNCAEGISDDVTEETATQEKAEGTAEDKSDAAYDLPSESSDAPQSSHSKKLEDNEEHRTSDYNSVYKAGENGKYSYVYVPNSDENKRSEKKNIGKYAVIAICSVIAVCIFCGVAFMVGMSIGMLKDLRENEEITDTSSGELDFGDEDKQESVTSDNTKADVEIPQAPSLDKDGVTSAGVPYDSFSEVYYSVSASVVEISTEKITNSSWMGQYITTGAGSGVIIEKDGYIVTNNHVIEGASNVTVRLNNGKEYSASLVGTDEESDIAVIKIDPADEELCVASIGNSTDLVVCEDILVIGNPLGSLGGSATVGKISATDRYISVDGENMVLLQTDAAINPGNSGGGMFNLAGQLIGIVNAKASGEDVEGLGFAIPINTAYSVMTELIEYGYVRGKVDCGLTLYDVTSAQVAMYYFRNSKTGVYVWASEYTDDFQYGDRIISIGGTGVKYSEDVLTVLEGYSVGDKVEFVVERNNKSVKIKFTLREYIPDYVDFIEQK